MKALVQEGSGSADVLHLREIDAPTVADDRVLVQVRAASVNAADYHVVHGAAIVGVIGKLLRQTPKPVRGHPYWAGALPPTPLWGRWHHEWQDYGPLLEHMESTVRLGRRVLAVHAGPHPGSQRPHPSGPRTRREPPPPGPRRPAP